MNLSEFRTRVARQSGMAVGDSTDLALIDGWVNEGVMQFLRDTKCYVVPTTMTATAGEDTYTLDSDILSMQALWYDPSASVRTLLQPITPEQLETYKLVDTVAGSSPRYYALVGANIIMVYPAAVSSSDSIHALYTPRPAAMATSGNSPDSTTYGGIPEEYHTHIEAYAKWKACEAEEHRPSQFGSIFAKEYDTGTLKVKAEMKRKAGAITPPAHIGRPGLGVSYSPGVDWR